MTDINIAEPTEVSVEFLQGMANRMAVSFHKYGLVKDGCAVIDVLGSLEGRLAKYRETGNTEWLMDVANFAMMEFMFPKHPDAHYRPTDSDEAPGRPTRSTGVLTRKANKDVR